MSAQHPNETPKDKPVEMDSFHRFTDLPLEIAIGVLEHELCLQPANNSPPPVLLALAGLSNAILYQEARRLYFRNNFYLTSTSIPVLGSKCIKELLPIKHIKIMLPLQMSFLMVQKICTVNRLEMLVFVLCDKKELYHLNCFSSMAIELTRASLAGVRKILVRAPGRLELMEGSRVSILRQYILEDLNDLDTFLGLKSEKTQISGDDVFTV
ncbi:hypothetical protein B7494_g2956 [Chlorociboria aeruginascens]|nr:hypothetical protein B7494_g2956 [Chlorociboria aeruginascens]